ELFTADAIKDDLLRMMFSCCDPRLPEPAQVALVLHILCGFSVGEIASAFVSTDAGIEKRITRAKKVLATSKRLFDVAASAKFFARLPSIGRSIYCSTRATMVHPPRPQCAANFAVRQCGSLRCSWSTHWERRLQHMLSPH